MAEAEQYGKKIDYDPLWLGPMSKPRSATDLGFQKALGIFCIVWLGISVYAFSNGDLSRVHNFVSSYQYKMDQAGDDYNRLSGNRFKRDDSAYRSTNPYSHLGSIISQWIGVSVLLCIAYIVSLRWFAKLIVYSAIALFFLVLFSVTFYVGGKYAKTDEPALLAGFIVCTFTFVALLILVMVNRKKINIACEVIKEASKCVVFFPSAFFFPLLPFALIGVTVIFAGFVLLNLVSIPNQSDDAVNFIDIFHLVNVFGFLWLTSFITGFSQMVLSGTFATWFWTHNKIYVPQFTIVRFMSLTVKNHLGTLAFGSLIMAICQFIKILLQFIKKRLEGSCNPLACLCFGWYQHLFGKLEKIVRYINRNAYIMSAVHGTSFYESAKNAFNLIFRNIIKCLIISKVTDGILFIGAFLTVSISLVGAYQNTVQQLSDPSVLPMILVPVAVVSTLITSFFFMVLRTAIDTIFLCVLEDHERNDGSSERPYYMSFKLKTLFLED